MRSTLFSIAAATIMVTGVGLAFGQSTSSSTSTTWTNDEGTTLRKYSTTRHYESFNQPNWSASVGAELPSSATIYPLPDTMHVPSSQQYSYSIINNEPVVVDRTTRKVVHTWD